MGYCSELDVTHGPSAALEMALHKAGVAVGLGIGVKAAEEALL